MMTRVWNVTSDPSTEMHPQNLLVMGKVLQPGQSLQVDAAQLEQAHKITAAVAAKLLYVGKEPPAYLAKAARATLPAGVEKGHTSAPTEVKSAGAATVAPVKPAEKFVEEAKPSEEEQHNSGRSGRRGR